MQAGTKESPQDFKQCLVGIRITAIFYHDSLVRTISPRQPEHILYVVMQLNREVLEPAILLPIFTTLHLRR